MPVVVDIDYRADQWEGAGAFAEQMRQLLRSATLAVGTEEELAAAAGTTDVAGGVAAVIDCGVEALILKRGARGSTVFRPHLPPADVAPFRIEVLNVLGAGDAFASGFLYGYLQGWPLERAARMGNATGAIVVTRHGCANFMPTLDEVDCVRQRARGGGDMTAPSRVRLTMAQAVVRFLSQQRTARDGQEQPLIRAACSASSATATSPASAKRSRRHRDGDAVTTSRGTNRRWCTPRPPSPRCDNRLQHARVHELDRARARRTC